MVIGPSGAGKSTFLRLLACLERPSAGDVFIGGEPTALLGHRARRQLAARRLGYVFQRPAENLLEYLTVAEHMTLAARMRATAARRSDAAAPSTRRPGGDRVAARGHRPRRPDRPAARGTCRPGEQQRLAFAMAVVGEPALVIADEPSAELDPAATAALADLLKLLSGLAHDPGHRLSRSGAHGRRRPGAGHPQRHAGGARHRRRAAVGGARRHRPDPAARRGRPSLFPGRAGSDRDRRRLAAGSSGHDRRGRRRAHARAGQALPARSGSGRPWSRCPDLDLVPGELTVVVGPVAVGQDDAGRPDRRAGPSPTRARSSATTAGLPLGDWSKLAVIPQGLALLGELSVVENITLASRLGGSAAGDVDACLDALDIAALRDRNPDEISVGERQRVMAARAVLPQPAVLLADEPVAHQDARRAEIVLDALAGRGRRRRGLPPRHPRERPRRSATTVRCSPRLARVSRQRGPPWPYHGG